MKDNVYLIKRINEMRKEEQELAKEIALLKRGIPGTPGDEGQLSEQQK